MAVLKPLKLIIENWEAGKIEELEAVNNPEDPAAGSRRIGFSRELWIEREDFEETPPPKYFRLFLGNAVRLRYAYIVTCTGFDKDAAGNITAVRCTADLATKGGNANAGNAVKVKGTIHWVSASDAIPLEARIYDYLFNVERPMEVAARLDGSPGNSSCRGEFTDNLNPNSLEVNPNAFGEPCLTKAEAGQVFQFERLGYFARDPDTGNGGRPVFNKTIGLRDTWAKIAKKG
jgi:glutaminyl-tRNA synthetase